MRNYPEFDEEDEDEEDEDGEREDETAPQPGEASKPRKKGVVTILLISHTTIYRGCNRKKTKEFNSSTIEFIFKRRRRRSRCRYFIPPPWRLLPAG